MKLKMLTTYASSKRMIHPGQIADFEEDEAKQLLDGQFAQRLEDVPPSAVRQPRQQLHRRPDVEN